MTTDRHPTMSELRLRVHKQRHREIGNWLARRVARPSAVYGTWAALRLGLSAHQVTLGSIVAGSAGAIAIATGDRWWFLIGVILAHLAFWLDHVDGQVARWRGTSSLDGVALDYLMHHASGLFLGFGLGQGLAFRTGDPNWSLAGFAIAFGWTFLSLQNDCRYKAFIQRLKASSLTYRVEGGSGGRPSPPMPWPSRGRAMLTWPAYKSCEPHVVLMGLTVLGGLAFVWPEAWLISWKWGVRAMAVLAPALAVARISRMVATRATEAEFDRWFRPIEPIPGSSSTAQTNSSSPEPE
jgi:hypothetical protein